MEKILISACLIGDKCKYDGHSNYSPLYKELLEKNKKAAMERYEFLESHIKKED